MSLADWLKNSWLVEHESSVEEIAALLAIVERELGERHDPETHLIPLIIRGRGYSVKEVIETCRRVTGQDDRYRIAGRRAGDPARLVARAARARAELGWSPEFDELAEIVDTAWRWFSRQPVRVSGWRAHREEGVRVAGGRYHMKGSGKYPLDQ